MKGKTVVITGGNDGIGFVTATKLAEKGAGLILVCRNEEKAKNAVQQIKSTTGNEMVDYVLCDLSVQSEIRQAAKKILDKTEKIDVLINNAGATFSDFQLTVDGLERTIAINHFAYFLLTGLLLNAIQKSDHARIVSVSSDSHYKGKIDFESFTKNKGYFVMKAYEQSKLANVLFTFELTERLKHTQITANCLHPGAMVKTKIGSKPGVNKLGSFVWKLLTATVGTSLEQGAATSVYLASSDEVGRVSGKYFAKCKPKEPNRLAYDQELRKKLWEVSENYSGFQYSFK